MGSCHPVNLPTCLMPYHVVDFSTSGSIIIYPSSSPSSPPCVPLSPSAGEETCAKPRQERAIVKALCNVNIAWEHLLKGLEVKIGWKGLMRDFHLWSCEESPCRVAKVEAHQWPVFPDVSPKRLEKTTRTTMTRSRWKMVTVIDDTNRDDLFGRDCQDEGIAEKGQWGGTRQVVEMSVPRVP